ncbi:right-handed parallel beta-helix repeat-containing protein, partial [Cellulomonas sp. B6]|uniref:right-handed parallel beta-helix repeat-containing protein n=1 Tax=Cellulomonas sp. B6 TaxID=1295626 RepID=UPI000A6FA0C3
GPRNTGVPAGTTLTVHEGDLKITEPNTVIDSMEVRGIVWVRAPGVVIKNSLITGRKLESSLSLVYAGDPGVSVTIEDSELYAKDPSPHVRGIIGSSFTLRRVNMHGVVDHMAITGDHVLVESSWLHDTLYYENDPYYNGTPTHDDNAQIAVGDDITFRGNTLSGTHNAAIQVTQDRGVVSNLTLDRNWISDGACSVNLAQNKWGPVRNVVITNNVFTRTQTFGGCAIIADHDTIPQITLGGNVWSDGKGSIGIQGRTTGQKGGS